MELRHFNKTRPVRDDQCRCRRCAAPILLTTAKRLRGKCAHCIQVPRWAYVRGIYRRTTLFVFALLIGGGLLVHSWNMYGWIARWQETFAEHPIAYGSGVFLVLLNVSLLSAWITRSRTLRRAINTGDDEDSGTLTQ